MNKKILSSILAGVMTVSTLSISASATVLAPKKLDSSTTTYTVDATLNNTEITASIPTAIKAVINPYKALITETNYADSMASGIASPAYKIINGMDKKLAVTVTPTITSSKTVELSETPLKQEGLTDKMVFAYLNTTTLESDDDVPLFRNTHYDASDKSQAIFKEEGEATANIMIIDETGGDVDTGYFRVEGDCTEKPEEKWTEKDTIKLSLVLDLAPSAGEVKETALSALSITGPTLVEKFDPAVTSYTATEDGTNASFTITFTAKDAAAFKDGKGDGKVFVFFNGKEAKASLTLANAGATDYNVFADGVTAYAPGDVVEIVMSNGIYSQTYKITIVAKS